MIIRRITAAVQSGLAGKMVNLMKAEGRSFFRVSRISTNAHPDFDGAEFVVFDLDFDDLAGHADWMANHGGPEAKPFFTAWGQLITGYEAQILETDDEPYVKENQLLILRITSNVRPGLTSKMVNLMKTDGRARYAVSRISTYANPEEGESNIVIFDLDFENVAALKAWQANTGSPENKDFHDTWHEHNVSSTSARLQTDG